MKFEENAELINKIQAAFDENLFPIIKPNEGRSAIIFLTQSCRLIGLIKIVLN